MYLSPCGQVFPINMLFISFFLQYPLTKPLLILTKLKTVHDMACLCLLGRYLHWRVVLQIKIKMNQIVPWLTKFIKISWKGGWLKRPVTQEVMKTWYLIKDPRSHDWLEVKRSVHRGQIWSWPWINYWNIYLSPIWLSRATVTFIHRLSNKVIALVKINDIGRMMICISHWPWDISLDKENITYSHADGRPFRLRQRDWSMSEKWWDTEKYFQNVFKAKFCY